MLSFFRNLTKSRIGLIAVFVVSGLIAIAMLGMDVTGTRSLGGAGGGVVARVGDTAITEKDLSDRAQIALDNYNRQVDPANQMTMAQFVAQGGLERTLEDLINSAAIEEFSNRHGIVVGDRIVDGMIASIPAFRGADGKFSQEQFEAALAQQRIPVSELRSDFRLSKYLDWMLRPVRSPGPVPNALAVPYASLMLERRSGAIGLLPTAAMDAGDEPSDAEVKTFYEQHKARYTVPERRVIRYAMVSPETLGDSIEPSEEEIAQAYRAAGDRFAAKEQRTVSQVIVGDRESAEALAQSVRGGQSVGDAARAAGLEPTEFEKVVQDQLAERTSDEVAKAAFAASRGDVVGPVESELGWHVLQVTGIDQVAAQSLDQARETLVEELRQRKLIAALGNMRDRLADAIADGATFDEVTTDNKLAVTNTAPLLPNGRNPDKPDEEPAESLIPVLRTGFAMQGGDDPQMVPVGDDSFALVAVGRVVPATPRPLDEIRDAVLRDLGIDRRLQAARKLAAEVVRKVNSGTTLKDALAATGKPFRLDPVATTRVQLAQMGGQVPPPVRLLFTMGEGRARLIEGENREGFYIVYLADVEQVDPRTVPESIAGARSSIAGSISDEFQIQFVESIRQEVGVTRNADALERVRSGLAAGR